MWNRAELKERAKKVLRKYYWIAFLVTLVASILGGSQGASAPSFSFGFNNNDFMRGGGANWQQFNPSDPQSLKILTAILIGAVALSAIALVIVALGLAFKLFVGGPIEVGMNRYFLEARQDRSDFANLFSMFRAGRYLNVVKANAWRMLFTFLWLLLFVIPGIIKGYSYSMIPYLMADNPGMDYQRAMKLSMAMTNGEKWNIFVLDLSFIGWYLLGLLACCVGILFVVPYVVATKAELYVTLRQKAIEANLCSAEELGQ